MLVGLFNLSLVVELHVFPHTVGTVQRREVKVATLRETATVVSYSPADLQRRHAADAHVAVLILHLGQAEASCGPPVFFLLSQHLQSLQMTAGHRLGSLVTLILSSRLASSLTGCLGVQFVPGEVGGVTAWHGHTRVRGDLTVRVKQCAKDSLQLLTLLTPPTSSTLPLPTSPRPVWSTQD